MKGRKGFLLIELVIGLFACALLLVAAGRLMRQSRLAEDFIEAKWASLLACRAVLELSCATGSPVDTSLVYSTTTIRAWSTVDSVGTGELIVRAHAAAVHDGEDRLELSRLVWPGKRDVSPRKSKA